jgi:hypothetical protein
VTLGALGRLAVRSWDAARGAVDRLREAHRHPPRRARLERFGAIVQLTVPRALVFVDRALARRTVATAPTGEPAGDPVIWAGPETAVGDAPLSAPLEAHLQLTNRCDAGCRGCYTGASPDGARGEWGLAEWMRAIDELADAGVFHVALGGGESAVLPWLGELADHARRPGWSRSPAGSARSTSRSTGSGRPTRGCAGSTGSRAPTRRSARCAGSSARSGSTSW